MQLKLRNTSLADIARSNGWSKSVVSQALRSPLYQQEVAIAEALGLKPETLFVERYDRTGRRRHAVKSSGRATGRNVEGARARRHAGAA
ncbi:helix-turn-helix domain-containing protein [Tistrella bauzanensis]|uniref:helix-turn-helix domain-containing protein n=1 Tax=Tistrella TaxID=171436 RepID=UPI0031F6BC57